MLEEQNQEKENLRQEEERYRTALDAWVGPKDTEQYEVQNQNEEETEEEREKIDTENESNKSPWAQQMDEEDEWDTPIDNENIMQKEQQNVNWENNLDDSYIPPRQQQTTDEQTSPKSTYSLMASMEVDEEERKQKERQLKREREEERKKKKVEKMKSNIQEIDELSRRQM